MSTSQVHMRSPPPPQGPFQVQAHPSLWLPVFALGSSKHSVLTRGSKFQSAMVSRMTLAVGAPVDSVSLGIARILLIPSQVTMHDREMIHVIACQIWHYLSISLKPLYRVQMVPSCREQHFRFCYVIEMVNRGDMHIIWTFTDCGKTWTNMNGKFRMTARRGTS